MEPSGPTVLLNEFKTSAFMQKLQEDKESAITFRRRRHSDWTDNYTLGRDKVQINRLTQRQSVNIPLIKSTVKTLLKDIDEPPILKFINLDNDEQAEVYYNEHWHWNSIQNKLVIKDIVDKRQEMYFGRSFKALNIADGKFTWEIVDPQDMLVDRYVDPSEIDTARFVIRQHIYKPLSSLLTNPKYDKTKVRRLQKYMESSEGLLRAADNQADWIDKSERMASMGLIDAFHPQLGETWIELNEFFRFEFNKDTKEDEIIYVVTAEDREDIYKEKLENCIGLTSDNYWRKHYPFTTWADETERTDFWSDGVVDSIRTLNKVLNAYFSQLVENRTLRNFGMNFYNSSLTDEGFMPQTFEPNAWGWYPLPVGVDGKIQDFMMNVPVPDLADTLKDMEFILNIAQQASAATATQQGVVESSPVTLGEIQLTLSNAQQRVKAMAVYYNASWEDFGQKYVKMLEAGADLIDPVTISKKGRITDKYYTKTISPMDWSSTGGYRVEVKMKEDQQAQIGESLQKLQYSKSLMPANRALDTIIKKKSLEFADLSATEMEEVLKEDEMQKQQLMGGGMGMPGAPAAGVGQVPAMGAPAPASAM